MSDWIEEIVNLYVSDRKLHTNCKHPLSYRYGYSPECCLKCDKGIDIDVDRPIE